MRSSCLPSQCVVFTQPAGRWPGLGGILVAAALALSGCAAAPEAMETASQAAPQPAPAGMEATQPTIAPPSPTTPPPLSTATPSPLPTMPDFDT